MTLEDNKYFHYYNANPKNKDTKDCTYRALSLFLGKSWEEIAELDAEFYLNRGTWFHTTEPFNCRLKSNTEVFLETSDCCKLAYSFNMKNGISTIRDFIDEKADSDKIYICPLERHIAVIKNNKVWDTWDSSNLGIHNIYVKEA